jgi:hypothetical protein
MYLKKTIPIKGGGDLKVTKNFTYLGVNINNELKDDTEIKKKNSKSNLTNGRIEIFFRNKQISLYTKYRVYMAIPISTLLWGSESWTITDVNKKRLRAFQHKTIRWILNINMYEVQHSRIHNKIVRKSFCNIPDIIKIIQKRQTNWIGDIAKMNTKKLPRKLIASWTKESRKPGRPQTTFRDSYRTCIQNLIPEVQPSLPLSTWIEIAGSPKWSELKNAWWKNVILLSNQ